MDFTPEAQPKIDLPQIEASPASYEPKLLPLQDVGQYFYRGTDTEDVPRQIGVVEKMHRKYYDEIKNKYVMVSEIAGLQYLFRFTGSEGKNPFSLAFKTLAYEYALTNLNPQETQKLFEGLADFVETAYHSAEEKIKLIHISPADSSYSTEEIEGCISEILKHSKEFSEEDLRNNYQGHKIFNVYYEMFEKNYKGIHYNATSKALARSRYFRIQFKKFFKNWHVEYTPHYSTDFMLQRKESVVE